MQPPDFGRSRLRGRRAARGSARQRERSASRIHAASAGYTYDRARNLYLRSVAGKAQIDAGDGKRVTARNVVVLFMRKSIDPHSEPGHARIVLDQIGSGPALVFREGRSWKATWRKASAGDITRFFGPDGAEIPLRPRPDLLPDRTDGYEGDVQIRFVGRKASACVHAGPPDHAIVVWPRVCPAARAGAAGSARPSPSWMTR